MGGIRVDRSGVDVFPGPHQPQPERQFDQEDGQVSSRGQMNESSVRNLYTRAKSPAMQYRESLERGDDRSRVGGESPALRKNSSGSSDGPHQRFMGPRGQSTDRPQALNLNGDDVTKVNRRQSLYSPVVNIVTNVEGTESSNELPIPSPKSSPKTARNLARQQHLGSAQREPGRHHSPPTPSSFNVEKNPPTTNGRSSPIVNGSSKESTHRQPTGWHIQNSAASLSTRDSSRKTSFASDTSVSSDRERGQSPAVTEPQSIQSPLPKPTQPRRPNNIQGRPSPIHYRSHESLGRDAAPKNWGSQMDSFYGGDPSLPGMKHPDTRNGEDENRPYPLELHLLHPQLLRALLQYFSFYDWCMLQGVNKNLRLQLSHVSELKEEVLERYLSTIGYSRWVWEDKEPLVISLRVRPSSCREDKF